MPKLRTRKLWRVKLMRHIPCLAQYFQGGLALVYAVHGRFAARTTTVWPFENGYALHDPSAPMPGSQTRSSG